MEDNTIESGLDLSLPAKSNSSCEIKFITMLLILVLLVSIANLVIVLRPGLKPTAQSQQLSAEQTRQLAAKLSSRNLYLPAVKVWQDYLAQAKPDDTQRAKILFQIAGLLAKAGQHEQAIEYYYRSEMAAKLDELTPEINSRIKDCFQQMGNFSALRHEIAERTGIDTSAKTEGDVIAEIGPEKITAVTLDAFIEEQVDAQLNMYAAFMPAEQLNEQKKQMLAQSADLRAKQQALQAYLVGELLYRKALDDNITEDPQVKETLAMQSKSFLGQHVLNAELAAKVNVTETDIQTYYQANKEKYIEQEKAKISNISAESEDAAKAIIASIQAGDQVDGFIETDVTKGSPIAGINGPENLAEMIFAATAGTLLDKPVQTETGWEVIRVDTKQPARQMLFEEVAQQIMGELTQLKNRDVQQQFIMTLMDEYNVIIHNAPLAEMPDSEKNQN
jgi:peptidyl-prolyl cis-trans isomerase C